MRAIFMLAMTMSLGCPGDDKDTGADDSGADDSGADDSGTVDTGGCGEDGICDVAVSDVLGECGEDAAGVPTLAASVEGPGQVRVKLADAEVGCCPTVSADVLASARTGEISFNYTVESDECDCACLIDVSLLVSDVPAGSWNVVWETQQVGVIVE